MYQLLQKYKVKNDRLCLSFSEDLKIVAEHDQVPRDPCSIEKSSLECVLGSLNTQGISCDTFTSLGDSPEH